MDNLGFGIETTVVGMTIVFGLLALLWALLEAVLRLDGRAAARRAASAERSAPPARPPARERAPVRITAPSGMDPDVVAAIAIAVTRHAEARRRQAAPAMRAYWPGSLLYASRWVASGRTRQNRAWARRGR